MITKMLSLGDLRTNCYLVGSETTGEGIIIDPGSDPQAILDEVRRLGLKVNLIVNTHGHVDHFMALEPVQQATGARFAIHADDLRLLPRAAAAAVEWFGKPVNVPEPDVLLTDGDILEAGDVRLTVIHTPGHSRGGICLYAEGTVFTGDTLFQMSIGRQDFYGGNLEQLLNSIATRLFTLPANTVVLPGHGPDTTIGFERQNSPFLARYTAASPGEAASAHQGIG